MKEMIFKRKKQLLMPLFALLALFIGAGSASAVVGGMTIGGCIYTGEGTATYTPGPIGPITTWETTYTGNAPILDAQVMIQNMHSGGTHIMYGTMLPGTNCWEATIPSNDGINPVADEVIAVFAAPGHAVTTREFNWDPDGRFSDSINGAPLPNGTAGWSVGGPTMGNFMHPTGVHPEAGADCASMPGECVSVWATGPQDAFLMRYPQKTTSLLHYVFYDHFTNGNDNGPVIEPGVNGVTVNVYDEHGNVVQSQKTGDLAFTQGGFVTDDGVLHAGPMAYGYVYFTGLPGDDEYLIRSDPSTVTQNDNPHFTLQLGAAHNGLQGGCDGPEGEGYDRDSCNWYQTYTEERGHLGEAYAWPGSPGTMDGGYLTWHGLIEKMPADVGTGNPALWGSVSGILIDSTGAGEEATTAAHGGRVPPTNARFEDGTHWNRTRSAAGWGGVPELGEPPSDVIPNSRVMDGRVVLYDLNESAPRVVATVKASNPIDFNDPATGGLFEFTSVPPGTYGIYAMDRDLNYVMFVGNQANVLPGLNASAGLILYERWGARSVGFVERNGTPVGEGYTVKNWFKAGTTKGAVPTNANGWFMQPFWPETGQMGFQFVDMLDGADFRGKIVTEQYQDVPTWLGFDQGPITYNWATHNSVNRAVGYATHNYFVDIQIEDIPLAVGNISGPVFFDHFSYKPDPAKHNRANGVYDEDEDRLWQGWTVELYDAPTLPGSCADLALPLAPVSGQYCSAGLKTATSEIGTFSCTLDSDCDTAPGAGDGKCAVVPDGLIDVKKTGKFTKSDNVKLGWNQPYTYPADEIGSMHAGPVRIFPGGGAIVPPATAIAPPADYVAVATAYPNIGTSLLETEAYVDSFDYAPMPGYYEFRDVTPGDYCVRVIPKDGYRHSPDTDVEPGGFKPVTVTGGLNSRAELGVNTTPTKPAGLCEVPVPSQNAGSFYTSLNGNGIGMNVVGYSANFKVRDEDILFYDGANFHMYFDGTAAGLPGYSDIDALQVVDSDTFYVSFLAPNSKNRQVQVPAGVTSAPFIADDEDIVLYDGGNWSLYFDGSLYGLGDMNGEDIDALSILDDGRLVISTRGSANSGSSSNITPLPISSTTGWTGVNPRPQDEDLIVFDGVGFDMYLDASDIALNNGNNEDVWGANVGPNGDIYLTTYKPFVTASGLTGNGYDIFTCRGAGTGRTSSCVSNDFDFAGLAANGFDNVTHETLDAISILRAGTCSNGTAYSCTMDAQCADIPHPFGIKLAGEIEGGMWDGMENLDLNPTSLLHMDAIAMFGSPIAVKDGNDYFLGVGYQGDTRCHGWNNFLHTPGAAMLVPGAPGYDPFSCRSTYALSQKPEFERRFAPGANRYIGNAPGFLWNRIDPSIPAGWYGHDIHNPSYESMELGIGVPQAGYKFESAWTPLLIPGGGGGVPVADICAIGISAGSFVSEPWGAVATFTVSDGWDLIQGAEVVGTWSNGVGQTCVTGITGQCALSLEKVEGGGPSVTFNVANIIPDQTQPWYAYNPAAGGFLNGACRTSATAWDPTAAPTSACSDGIDNDGDGLVDFPDDGGCTSAADTDEAGPFQCSDGIDNDGDGNIDFPADPGCVNAQDDNEAAPVIPTPMQCEDGIDNDGDGLVDFPDDPGCTDALDNDEIDPVVIPPFPGPGATSVHIASLSGYPTWIEGKLIGNVNVSIADDTNAPVSGATVTYVFEWVPETELKQNFGTCVTDATGSCFAQSEPIEAVASIDFFINRIEAPGMVYDPRDDVASTLTVP